MLRKCMLPNIKFRVMYNSLIIFLKKKNTLKEIIVLANVIIRHLLRKKNIIFCNYTNFLPSFNND